MKNAKVAVFFPGIGYTLEKPLLYYSIKMAQQLGYDIKTLPYDGFPAGVRGDDEKMQQSYEIALEKTKDLLKDEDFSEYEEVLFVGKSIGTIVAAKMYQDSQYQEKIRMVLYTPLDATFMHDFTKAIVFTGDADPWVGGEKSKIADKCEERKIPCYVYENANHSLETRDVIRDMQYLQEILEKTKDYMMD